MTKKDHQNCALSELEKEVERRREAGEEVEDFADALEKSKLLLNSVDKNLKINRLRNMMAITLQTLVQKVGPLPDQYDERIKNIFKSEEPYEYVVPGLIFEECLKSKSFEGLERLEEK